MKTEIYMLVRHLELRNFRAYDNTYKRVEGRYYLFNCTSANLFLVCSVSLHLTPSLH